MKIIDNVRENGGKILAGVAAVLVLVAVIVIAILGIGNREPSATASSGNASAGNLKKEKESKKEVAEEETTSNPESESEEETVLQVTVISEEVAVIQNPDGTTSTLNPGETLNIVKEITNEDGTKMYQLDNGGYIAANQVSQPVTKTVTKATENGNNKTVTESTGNPATTEKESTTQAMTQQTQTSTQTIQPTQSQQPTQAPTQATTQTPTQAPTQPVTEAPTQNPWLSYEGYREEEIEIFKQKLVALRQEHYGGSSTDYAIKYSNPQWNDTLYKIAKERAKEIAQDYPKNFDHVSAGNYLSGYNLGENISAGCISNTGYAEQIYAGWYQSEGHRSAMISGGDQYAVAFYQKNGPIYAVFIVGDTDTYCAENYASYYSVAWKELGLTSQQQAHDYLYNSFVSSHGTPVIR